MGNPSDGTANAPSDEGLNKLPGRSQPNLLGMCKCQRRGPFSVFIRASGSSVAADVVKQTLTQRRPEAGSFGTRAVGFRRLGLEGRRARILVADPSFVTVSPFQTEPCTRVAIWAVCSIVGAGHRLGGLSAVTDFWRHWSELVQARNWDERCGGQTQDIHLTVLGDDDNQVSKKCHISLDETQIA